MASFFHFSCTETGCLNNGTCITLNSTTLEVCLCKAPFVPDFEWFHLTNCYRTQHSSFIFLLFYSAQYAILLLFFLPIVYRLKNEAKKVGLLWILTISLVLITVLSIYFQNGCYESCAVFGNLTIIVVAITLVGIFALVVKPVFSFKVVQFDRYFRLLQIWVVFTSAILLSAMISMYILTSNENLIDLYNLAAFISAFSFWATCFIELALIIVACFKLENEVFRISAMASLTQANLLKRIKHLRYACTVLLLPFFSLMIVIPIVFQELQGTFPYFYIILYFQFELVLPMAVGLFSFLRSTQSGTSSHPARFESGSKIMIPHLSGSQVDTQN